MKLCLTPEESILIPNLLKKHVYVIFPYDIFLLSEVFCFHQFLYASTFDYYRALHEKPAPWS